MNILQKIAARTKERVDARKKVLPLRELMEMTNARNAPVDVHCKASADCPRNAPAGVRSKAPAGVHCKAPAGVHCKASADCPRNALTGFPFEKALRSEDIAFICEVKRASPSKGIIANEFPYLDIAKDYEAAGAAAVSVLTEPFYFKGDDDHLREIANTVSIPLLRKDFTVDRYMIYEAKLLGASAVLLICSLLERETLEEFIYIAHGLGLSALVETHSEAEVDMALTTGARIIGANNRNLETFEVDIALSGRLKKMVPPDIVFVSESGIRTADDVEILRQNGVDAVLVGETLMRSPDKKAALAELRDGNKAAPAELRGGNKSAPAKLRGGNKTAPVELRDDNKAASVELRGGYKAAPAELRGDA